MLAKKNYSALIWSLAIAINGLIVVSIFSSKITALQRYDLSVLPLVNAVLNGATFLSLLAALLFIMQKNIRWHKRMVLLAFSFTSLFLVSYLLYHFTTPSTQYGGTSALRYVYYFLLLTHIVLAIIIVPVAMITMNFGLGGNIARHRRIARWAMPAWLYVSLTGVIVYVMISPYYIQ